MLTCRHSGPAAAGSFRIGMTGFSLRLASLPSGASRQRLEAAAGELGLPAEQWPEAVVADLGVEKNGDRVTVRGTLAAVARLECVRCLKRFDLPLRVPFEVFAERAGTSRHRDEEVELERDDYMMFHDGQQLDLREQARETLLLEVPMTPHCREDCQGLCPTCGADRNAGPCGCTA